MLRRGSSCPHRVRPAPTEPAIPSSPHTHVRPDHPARGSRPPMRKIKRRWIVLGSGLLAAVGVPAVLWLSLTHRPKFYQAMAEIPRERRQSGARRFVAQSLQLRNDIVNEPRWEAAFTDEEVNA